MVDDLNSFETKIRTLHALFQKQIKNVPLFMESFLARYYEVEPL